MWEIHETRTAARYLDKLPRDILQRYEKWKDVVRISGPEGLKRIRGFNDEALAGEWSGHPSSRLNQQYRVIYRTLREAVTVEVVRVSAHDYRKR